jgi:uncharacterized membrane protein YkoI
MTCRLSLAVSLFAATVLAAAGPRAVAEEPPAAEPPVLAQQPDCLGADWRQQQGEARAKVKNGSHLPLERVVEAIRRLRRGRLLDACLEVDPDGRSVYRVRWAAADGRRVDFRVDAATGAILSGG